MDTILCSSCLKENQDGVKICKHCNKTILLNDRYKILKILGANIGTTFLSKDITNDKKYTIKELSIKKIKSWKNEELFKREQKIVSNLDHQYIPKIVDTFEIKKGRKIRFYTVIEYIEGKSLREIIKRGKIFTKQEIIIFFKQFSEILEYIHTFSPPIIHRDIKPSNIIVKDGKYYLIDFGSVTDLIKEEGGSTIAGTFGYMAPEQLMGKADISSDYYSMGIVAIEILIGLPPEDFIKDGRIDWENIAIKLSLKEILRKLTADDSKDRVKNRDELIDLVENSLQRIDYDIDKIIESYENLVDKYENLKKDDKKFPLIGVIVYFFTDFFIYPWGESGIITTAFAVMIVLWFSHNMKNIKFIEKTIKTIKVKDDDVELNLAIFELFCRKELFRSNKFRDTYFENYVKVTKHNVDVDLLIDIKRDFKSDPYLREKIYFLDCDVFKNI